MATEIDPTLLSRDTLTRVLMETVLQDGTDYGDHELSLSEKIDALEQRVLAGDGVIVWDETTSSCRIVPREHAPAD